MKLCRFNDDRLGVVTGDAIADVTVVLEALPPVRYPLPRHDLLIAHLPKLTPLIVDSMARAPRYEIASVRMLSPLANPGKLIAAPVNYVKHLQEVLDDPNLHHQNRIDQIHRAGLFLKASSSLAGCGQGIVIDQLERRTDHEVELAVVIGRVAKNVNLAQALDCVAGYCIGLDITIRGPEERSLRKSPDSYSVLGPWLVTADELADPGALSLDLKVNGELRQAANTSELILGVPELICFASRFYTLYPGDVIFTGTPQGVAPIEVGDRIEARIDRIGAMQVAVHAASEFRAA